MFASKDALIANAGGGYPINNSLRFRSGSFFSRTFGAGSSTSWTWSGWVKRGILGAYENLLSAPITAGSIEEYFGFNSDDSLFHQDGTFGTLTKTSAVFRDPSAWYHIVYVYNSANATQSLRGVWYINGVQQANSTNAISSSRASYINGARLHTMGRLASIASQYFDGYFAETNFIGGSSLGPTDFGAFNSIGIWQPKLYTGSYAGTNSFYLNYSDTTALTSASNVGIGKDFSGNANYWLTNGPFSVTAGVNYDPMLDSPTLASATVANYGVINPLKIGGGSVTNGNLQFTANTVANQVAFGTMAISSGKYYFEAYLNQGSPTGNAMVGVYDAAGAVNTSWYSAATGWALDSNADGNFYKRNNAGATSLGARTNPGTVMVAIDKDANKIWFGVSGTWFGSGDPAAGTNAAYTNLSSAAAVTVAVEAYSNQSAVDFVILNCGQRPFSYTPPTGFVALNAYNLPTPTIANGATVMAATTFTAQGTTPQTVVNTGNTPGATNGYSNNPAGAVFTPDLVWTKPRSITGSNVLNNSVAGASKYLVSDTAAAEVTNAQYITSFNSNGFSVGTSGWTSGSTMVGWQWLAGAGSSSSNTNGSITSTVSVNATAGFSVVTYTGTGANATVGHGLGVAPSMVIIKQRTALPSAQNWIVGHTSLAWTNFMWLDLTNGTQTSSLVFNNTAPTSSVFSIGTGNGVNYSASATYVAYCWSAVAGYSAFGSYTGNGSADGPFVYLGFRPRYILWKRTDTTADWGVIDTSRDPYNTTGYDLTPNAASAEGSGYTVDFLSNGFKIRLTATRINASGGTYIYAAFAENPFNYALAR
jgi:hypothetical protein